MPATNISLLTLSVIAAAALTEGQPVAYDGTVAADGAAIKGVAETDAAIGDRVALTAIGTGIATAGAVIAEGALVQVSGGKFITKAAGISVGRALQAAGADGDKFELLLIPA